MKPLFWGDPEAIYYVETVLHSGEIVLAEGDTVLGLLADISEQGHAKLDSIKKRSKKPYLVLVENKQKAFEFIEKNQFKICQIEKIMDLCWPGPVTLIFQAKAQLPEWIKSSEGNVAIRVPDHVGLLRLLKGFDGLFSTSANIAGASIPKRIKEVDESIMTSVACVILNNDYSEATLPSTIIDCTGKKIKIIREGAFSVEKLSSFLN